MKEPIELESMLHVLVTMDDRTHVITHEQCVMIVQAQNDGRFKTISIGNSPVTLHQIAGMPELNVYRRQMKNKLAEKNQRMCRRCGDVLHALDKCGCREMGRPSFFETAAKENPKLKEFLQLKGWGQLCLPEPKKEEHFFDHLPTPKEKHQIAVIQSHKDKFLGKVSMKPLDKVEQSGTLQKVTP